MATRICSINEDGYLTQGDECLRNSFLSRCKCGRCFDWTCSTQSVESNGETRPTTVGEGEFTNTEFSSIGESEPYCSSEAFYRSDASMLSDLFTAVSMQEPPQRSNAPPPKFRSMVEHLPRRPRTVDHKKNVEAAPLGLGLSPMSATGTRLCVNGDPEQALLVRNTFIDSRPACDDGKRSSSAPPASAGAGTSSCRLEVMPGSIFDKLEAPIKPTNQARSWADQSEDLTKDWISANKEPLWSRGAADHDAGNCSPCAWFWKSTGCHRGDDCGYCHKCDAGQIRARKHEKVRFLRALKTSQQLRPGLGGVPSSQSSSSQSSRMRGKTHP